MPACWRASVISGPLAPRRIVRSRSKNAAAPAMRRRLRPSAPSGTFCHMADSHEAWVELPSRDLLRQFGVEEHHGFIPQMFRLVAAHPRVTLPFAALTEAVMGAPGVLTR